MGYPRAHGQEGVLHRSSSDRFSAAATAAEPHAEDEEVADLFVGIRDVAKGFGDAMGGAESGPTAEDAVLIGDGSPGARLVCGLQSRLEVREEVIAVGRCTSCQGFSCG